jgi:drug/metabolite transporter (DMT)-like permease
MKIKKTAYFYLLLTILLWSAIPGVAKIALKELNNFQLLFYNNILSVISLTIIIIIKRKIRFIKKYNKKDYIRMISMGLLGVYLYYIFIFKSFSIAPAGQANMINYLWPLFTIIFSILILKEKANKKTLLAILLSFFGAVLVFTEGNILSLNIKNIVGYLFALAAAASYGLFSVLGKKIKYEKYTSTFIYFLSSMIFIIPTAIIISGIKIPSSLETILAIIFMGGFANCLGYVFWFKALELGQTHKIANLIYINPFISIVFVYFMNGEIIPIISILGLVLIISGIVLQLKNNKNKKIIP